MGLVSGAGGRPRARRGARLSESFAARFAILTAIGLVERLAFTRIAWPRRIISRLLRDRLALFDRHFDAKIYLAQLRSPLRRRRAARAPVLHYTLLGWLEDLAPNARFDPRFARAKTSSLRFWQQPLHDSLQAPRDTPINEVEAVAAAESGGDVSSHGAVLVLHHGRGGGSSRFLRILESAMLRDGLQPIRLRRLQRHARHYAWQPRDTSPKAFDLDDPALLAEMRAASVTRILVNHTIDQPADIFDWIARTARSLDIPYDLVLHDYFAVCPRVNLIDDAGRYCGIASTKRCETCVRKGGSEVSGDSVAAWRAANTTFIAGARNVIAPSLDLATRIASWIGRMPDVRPPESDADRPSTRPIVPRCDEPLRVATLGALTHAKGCTVLLNVARAAQATSAPLAFTAIGETSDRRKLHRAGVAITGPYDEAEMGAHIGTVDPHVILLPAIWPETWSFVLSHALAFGLPVVAFDIGAPPERLRALGRGEYLMPYDWIDRPDKVVRFLGALRTKAMA